MLAPRPGLPASQRAPSRLRTSDASPATPTAAVSRRRSRASRRPRPPRWPIASATRPCRRSWPRWKHAPNRERALPRCISGPLATASTRSSPGLARNARAPARRTGNAMTATAKRPRHWRGSPSTPSMRRSMHGPIAPAPRLRARPQAPAGWSMRFSGHGSIRPTPSRGSPSRERREAGETQPASTTRMFHVAAAEVHDPGWGRATAEMIAAAPQANGMVVGTWLAALTAISYESLDLSSLQDASRYCEARSLGNANRRDTCEKIATLLADRSTTLFGAGQRHRPRQATRLARRRGWPRPSWNATQPMRWSSAKRRSLASHSVAPTFAAISPVSSRSAVSARSRR